MFKCPNCNEYTISFFSKWLITPLKIFMFRNTIRCKKCNSLLTVPLWTFLFNIALLLGLFGLLHLVTIFIESSRNYAFIPAILYCIIYFFLPSIIVPIIKINEDE